VQIINDYDQLSDEWFKARCGSIGGSSIATACAKGRKNKNGTYGVSKTRTDLLYRFAGEILTGKKYESHTNEHMLRGIEREPKARQAYEFERDVEVEQVGMVIP
jgi:hypothetical protein